MTSRWFYLVPAVLFTASLALGISAQRAAGEQADAAGHAHSRQGVCPMFTSCNPIKHIVFIIKENRSFDSMFGRCPGANGAITYTDPAGQVRSLNHQPDSLITDIAHNLEAASVGINHG